MIWLDVELHVSDHTPTRTQSLNLKQNTFLFTSQPIKAGKTRTNTTIVITRPSTRAIATFLVAKCAHGIVLRGALLHAAVRPSPPSIAQTAQDFIRVPRNGVLASSSLGQELDGQALATFIAVIGTIVSLTSQPSKSLKALAIASGSVANAFIGAFNPWMCVIRANNTFRHPGISFGAHPQRAVGASPLLLQIQAQIARAPVALYRARSTIIAIVFTHASFSPPLLVLPEESVTISFFNKRRG